MKRTIIILAALLLCFAHLSAKDFNSLSQDGLKGKVMSVKSRCYTASVRSGEVCKASIISDEKSDYDVDLCPMCLKNYDLQGNLTNEITYDDTGLRQSVDEYEYVNNVKISNNGMVDWGDGDLTTLAAWSLVLDKGKPVGQEFWFKGDYELNVSFSDLRNHKFDGYKVMSYDRYVDGAFEERVENTYSGNLLTNRVYTDKYGNITLLFTQVWNEAGQVVYRHYDSQDDEYIEEYKYNKNGSLVKYSKKSSEDPNKEYTFKYFSHDSKGNWTKRIVYSFNKPYIVEERTITYYTSSSLAVDEPRVERIIADICKYSCRGANNETLANYFAPTIWPHPSGQERYNYNIGSKIKSFVDSYSSYKVSQPRNFQFVNNSFPLTVICYVDVTWVKNGVAKQATLQKTFYLNSDYKVTGYEDVELSRMTL
jgi:hypothetical protein